MLWVYIAQCGPKRKIIRVLRSVLTAALGTTEITQKHTPSNTLCFKKRQVLTLALNVINFTIEKVKFNQKVRRKSSQTTNTTINTVRTSVQVFSVNFHMYRTTAVFATGQWPRRWLTASQTLCQSGVASNHLGLVLAYNTLFLHVTPNLVIYWAKVLHQ